eukprot:764458-Hanusia_phi.AAC.3
MRLLPLLHPSFILRWICFSYLLLVLRLAFVWLSNTTVSWLSKLPEVCPSLRAACCADLSNLSGGGERRMEGWGGGDRGRVKHVSD